MTAIFIALSSGCGVGEIGGPDALDFEDALRGKTPNGLAYANPAGVAETFSIAGPIDFENPFFQSLGSNGRACVTCHLPSDGWGLRPESARAKFDSTGGVDPLFRTNDGSVCPGADVSTVEARRTAYALLLSKGLIRIQLELPADAEFVVADSEGTYCNDIWERELSVFRRPLPTTNLKFLPTVMWDGRETMEVGVIRSDLANQASHATLGHAEGKAPLAEDVLTSIVDFETTLFTAQTYTNGAGSLLLRGALAGPEQLARTPFEFGVNDEVHSELVMNLFDTWKVQAKNDPVGPARASIARGQEIFNHKTFRIVGVAGQDSPDFLGQCSTCHLTPNVGNYSTDEFFDIGISSARGRTPDLPLYTLRNKVTGELKRTSDPGRAAITGRWADVGEFKPPSLRALATRAPFFHNGASPSIDAVVDFYDARFAIGLTPQEHADLVAFLSSL